MKTTIQIQNLKCGGCEKTILKNLTNLKDIADVSINQEDTSVSFTHSTPGIVEIVKSTLSKLGYPPIEEENKFSNKVKSYISCALGKISD